MSSLVPRLILRLDDIEGLECTYNMFVPIEEGNHQCGLVESSFGGELTPSGKWSEKCFDRWNERQEKSPAAALQSSHRPGGDSLHPARRLKRERLNEPAIANEVAMTLGAETMGNSGYGAQEYPPNFEMPLSTPVDVHGVGGSRFARDSRRGHQRHRQSTTGAKPWAFGVPGPLASEGAETFRARGEGEDAVRSRHRGSKGLDGGRSRVKALSSSPTPRRASLTLQSDLEDAARVVCQLHGRLANASNRTERLIRERNASRNEVAKLRAQVQDLEPGIGALSSSMRSETLKTSNAHHHHYAAKDDADADNHGSTEDEDGYAIVDCDESMGAGSRPSSPLSQGNGCVVVVPTYTPPVAHVPQPNADTTGGVYTAGVNGIYDSRERPAEAEERSPDSLVENIGEDPNGGVGRILETSAQRCTSGGEANDGRSEELFMPSGVAVCSHEVGLTADANTATSMRRQRAQSTPVDDGSGPHGGETPSRGARESPMVWSNGSDDGEANNGSTGQGGTRFTRQHGRAQEYPTPEKKKGRHRGGRQKQRCIRSTGERTHGDGSSAWGTAALGDEGAGADLMGAGEMLETLVDLSTKLRRLSLAEGVGAFRAVELRQETRTVVNDGVLKQASTEEGFPERVETTDRYNIVRSTEEIPTVHTSGEALPPCYRCAILFGAVQDARGRINRQERLLEKAEELRLKQEDRLSLRASADRTEKEATAGNAHSSTRMKGSLRYQASDQQEASGAAPGGVQELGEKGSGKEAKSAGEDRGPAGGGTSTEELLAAAEAVWRISEMARNVLEGELDRRGEALASAKREAKESKTAFSKQVQELSSAQAALRMQESVAETWKSEAEKSGVKEKNARRALESVRIAAGDATRRSERKTKALRAEADDLRQNVSTLKTRLACVKGRRQAELEMANKKIEHLEHTISHLESALAHRESRRNQQAKVNLRYARHLAADSPPVPCLDNDESSQRMRRSTSISPEESGEKSRRTRGIRIDSSDISTCEINRIPPRGAAALFLEAEISQDSYPEDGCTRERVGRTGKGKGKGGVNAGRTGHDCFTDDIVRERPAAPAHSRPATSAESATPIMTTAAVEIVNGEGGRRSSGPSSSPRSLARESLLASARKGEQREPGRGGRNGGGRRRVSEATAAVDERDRWVPCVEKPRRVSAPAITEHVTKVETEADRERVLRRASQSHRPPYALLDHSSSGRSDANDSGIGRDQLDGIDRPRHKDRCSRTISDANGGDELSHRVEREEKGGRDCKGKPGCGALDAVDAEEGKRAENATIGTRNAITDQKNTIIDETNLSPETKAVGGSLLRDCSPPPSQGGGWKAALIAALRAKVAARVAMTEGGGRATGSLGTGGVDGGGRNLMASREQVDIFTEKRVGGGVRTSDTTDLGVSKVVENAGRPAHHARKEKSIVGRGTGRPVEEEEGVGAGIADISGGDVYVSDSLSYDDGGRRVGAETGRSTSDRSTFALRQNTAKENERVRHGPSKSGLSGDESGGNGSGESGGSPSQGDASDNETFFEADVQPGNRRIPRSPGLPTLDEMQGGGTYDTCEVFTPKDQVAGGNGGHGATWGWRAVGGDEDRHFPGQRQFFDASLDFWNSVSNAGLSEEDLEGVVAELTEEEAEALLRGWRIPNKRGNHNRTEKQVAP